MLGQEAHRLLDPAVELRIDAAGELGGIVYDVDVGIHAVALGEPAAIEAVLPERRHGERAAVGQRRVAADADEARPTSSSRSAGRGGLP